MKFVCLYCGSRNSRTLYSRVRDRLGYIDGSFEFVQCGQCGSAMLHPLPSEEDVPGFYPPHYVFLKDVQHNNKILNLLQKVEWKVNYQQMYQQDVAVLKEFTGLSTGRLLDVGCGSGLQLREIAKSTKLSVEGLDIDGDSIEYARALGLTVHHGSLTDVSFEEDRFDVVTLYSVLEHFLNPLQVLREIRRILKPGGWVVIKVPCLESWQSRFFGKRWTVVTEAPRHVSLPTRRGMELLLGRAGFSLEREFNCSLIEDVCLWTLSTFPWCSTTHTYQDDSGLLSVLWRLIGIGLAVLALPIGFAETCLGISGTVTYFARKPGAQA